MVRKFNAQYKKSFSSNKFCRRGWEAEFPNCINYATLMEVWTRDACAFTTPFLPLPSIASMQHSFCRYRLCDGQDGEPWEWACPGRAPDPHTRMAGLAADTRPEGERATRMTRVGHRPWRYSNWLATHAPREPPSSLLAQHSRACSNYSNKWCVKNCNSSHTVLIIRNCVHSQVKNLRGVR